MSHPGPVHLVYFVSLAGDRFVVHTEMDAQHPDLQAVFTYLQSAVVPVLSTEELASQLSLAIKHSPHTLQPSQDSRMSEDTEMTCMCLTLVGKIISKLASKSLPPEVSDFFDDVIRKLFGAFDLTSDLLHLMNCQDRMMAHLAARCIADFVIHNVDNKIDGKSMWKMTFSETFQSSPPSCTLDTHLWALTDIIKRILKLELVNRQDVLMKLLVDLESSLTSLFSKLLFQDTPEDAHSAENDKTSVELGVSICALMDLVEVFSAARLQQGLCSSVQRLVYLQTPAILRLTLCNIGEFVKKRALLLLKRVLLQRAGEERGLGANSSKKHDDEYASDLLVMADATLQEVEAGWLRKFCVKSRASFFGGSKLNVPDGEMKDAVMLRAVSLILIKCLEIKTRHVSAQGAHHAVDIQSCLSELMEFLQQQGLPIKAVAHLCSWIIVVFADQDDDLIESAKVLITLHLHQRSSNPLEPACQWGYNPHCHFTLLLRSLSFDHSVLLDFLISDETCFLEYLVLYLKHLRDHWQDFSSACCHIEHTETETHTLTRQHVSEGSVKTEVHKEFRNKVAGFRPSLVSYECSDDSEDDDRIVSNIHVGSNAGDAGAEIDMRKADEGGAEDREGKSGSASSEGLKEKVMSCLSELRTVISRLHSRGLFPYNPSSLLKLLLAVEAKGQLGNPTPHTN